MRASSMAAKGGPRRIAVVINGAFALINFRGSLIGEFIDRGAQVFAFAPDFDDKTRAQVAAMGATPVDYFLERSGANPFAELGTVAQLVTSFRSLRIDSVLNCFIKPAIYGTIAARLAGVGYRVAMIEGLGYVFTNDGTPPGRRRRVLARVVRGLLRIGLSQAHTVLVLNEDDRALMIDERLVASGKIKRIAGTGVNLARFAPAPSEGGSITFLMVARLLREKGVFEFVDAARLVRRRVPNARFRLVGGLDDNPGAISREAVEDWVREGSIEWTGHVDAIEHELSQASVFVLPSWREGAPRSTQEALACGLPVITTWAPGTTETVIEGQNGFKVPVRDPKALAAAMLECIQRPELLEAMGRASRALAESRYDERKINSELADLFELPARPI